MTWLVQRVVRVSDLILTRVRVSDFNRNTDIDCQLIKHAENGLDTLQIS